jgi:hypothetical protein
MSHWWIVGILLLNACAPIKETMNVTTQTSQSLTAGVGDVVLRAENLQNLPNVFGASDIWAARGQPVSRPFNMAAWMQREKSS